MNIAKFKALGLACVYFLFVVFSVSVNARDLDQLESGVSLEGWLPVGGQDLAILDFDEPQIDDEIYQDVRVENVTVDSDGSTRFQLTHSGPLSRQVFAHVRRVEQDDGYTRSIITNIADGTQMEYLTYTSDDPVAGKIGKASTGGTIQKTPGDDQTELCPMCPLIGLLVTEATCAISTSIAHHQCRMDCQRLGGVKVFKTGICGMYNSECHCMVDPRRTTKTISFDR